MIALIKRSATFTSCKCLCLCLATLHKWKACYDLEKQQRMRIWVEKLFLLFRWDPTGLRGTPCDKYMASKDMSPSLGPV